MEGYDYLHHIASGQGQQDQSRHGYQTTDFEPTEANSSHEVPPDSFLKTPCQYVQQQSTNHSFQNQPLQISSALYETANTSTPQNPGIMSQQTAFAPMTDDSPGLIFNGYRIEPSANPIPEEFIRIPTGTSIAEPGSILDEESGRTYYNHHTGKYFFPNDAVSTISLSIRALG